MVAKRPHQQTARLLLPLASTQRRLHALLLKSMEQSVAKELDSSKPTWDAFAKTSSVYTSRRQGIFSHSESCVRLSSEPAACTRKPHFFPELRRASTRADSKAYTDIPGERLAVRTTEQVVENSPLASAIL